ncbi:hypothetical protein OIDMADRAFT_42879 [Oidiodendron maius Zn]|uniref:NmrA-like domain-containing protein n=1 Tax=Oidiodendron maius (strain Zn) TaxID=913774 RepID=A0A0C3CLU4_OIDMZ|nr:hypothetical protein OIDMADRAFT_42879 [Oidiodendron maius Zn]
MAPKFLITGATGVQGGATAQAGAILFQGDFDDTTAIKAAITGASGIFLNPFPTMDPELSVRQAQNFIDAAIASKTIKTIVLSTAFFTAARDTIWGSTDPHRGLQHYYNQKIAIEGAVKSSGLQNYTILRPCFLMQNYLLPQAAFLNPELSSEGVLAHIYDKGRKMPHLDAEDVGKFAAAALLNPGKFRGEEIELGNENLTVEEVAAMMKLATGKDVGIRKRSEEEAKRVWNQNPSLRFQGLANEVDLSMDGAALGKKYGIPLNSFEEFLTREREVLIETIAK